MLEDGMLTKDGFHASSKFTKILDPTSTKDETSETSRVFLDDYPPGLFAFEILELVYVGIFESFCIY